MAWICPAVEAVAGRQEHVQLRGGMKVVKTTLTQLLATEKPILADGAMGTVLMALGLESGESPVLWNATRPEDVRGVHRRYIEAGAQIVLTNTFSGNRLRLRLHDLADRAVELNRLGAELATLEAEAAATPVLVAGDIGPTGQVLEPLGDLSYDEAAAAFEEQAAALLAGGVDAFWVETMYDPEEVRAAVEGIRRVAPEADVVATLTFDAHGHTMMGVAPEAAVQTMAPLGLAAEGGNCGNGVVEILDVVRAMRGTAPDRVLVAKANAGVPHLGEDGQPVYDAAPSDMADYALQAVRLGARIVGGCCGSTPEHVRAMHEALRSA